MKTNPALLKTFNGRVEWFLSYIYDHGGSEYKGNNYDSYGSYLIPEALNPDEFNRIIEALLAKGWVSCRSINPTKSGTTFYNDLKLTEAGIKEAEKTLPQIPMFGLVNQEITTGDSKKDGKINHAKRLFFGDPQTMDNMRSACEALCFVIEPLRDELTPAITIADVNEFFLIVNRFDIRHNKDSTKNLIYPEQLEWVFYSLLNTLNAYTKLKRRLNTL